MRKLLQVGSIPTLILLSGFLTQVGIAQSTAIPSKAFEGEQHLNSYVVHPAKSNFDTETAQSETVQPRPDAPAPNLTSVITYNTCGQATSSSSVVCENTQNVSATANHYPTSIYKVYEVVRVYGYGSQPIAKLGGSTGSTVPSSALVETDYLCGSNYTICTTGQTVTGFQYWYDLTSMLAANYPRTFYVQSTGTNNPGTTLSSSILIQL